MDDGTAHGRATPQHITPEENELIRQHGIYFAAASIIGVFLGLYLFDLGGTNAVAQYYCGYFGMIVAGYAVAGLLFRRLSTRQFMRAGCLITITAYVLLLVVKEQAPTYALLVGILSGFGGGLYWAGVITSEYVITHEHTRNLYFGKAALFQKLGSTVGPPLAGVAFTLAAYLGAREDGFYLLFVALIVLLMMTWHQARKAPSLGGIEYRPKASLRAIRNGEWALVLTQQFLGGVWTAVFTALAPILLFQILGNELQLSVLSGLTTVLAGATGLAAGRVLRRWRRAYWLGAIGVPVGILGIALEQSWLGIAAYVFLATALDPFAKNSVDKSLYDAIDRTGLDWRHSYHLLVERELALDVGRISSFVLVMWLTLGGSEAEAMQITLLAIAPIPVVVGVIQARLDRYRVVAPLVAPESEVESLSASELAYLVEERALAG